MGWSKKYKRSIDCNNPKGFSQKAHCAGRKKRESVMSSKLEELVGKPITEAQFDEAAGKKDACYHKVKARYDVWPSAYASGALVKCRKVGAKNWGNKSKKESVNEGKLETLALNLLRNINKETGISKYDHTKTAHFNKVMKFLRSKMPKAPDRKLGDIAMSYDKYRQKQPKIRIPDIDSVKDMEKTLKKLGMKEGVNEAPQKYRVYVKQKAHVGGPASKKFSVEKFQTGGMYFDYKKGMDTIKKLRKMNSTADYKLVKEGLDNLKAIPKDLKKSMKKKRNEARGTCWVGYQQVGMKKKGGKMVPNCVKEIYEIFYEEDGKAHGYTFEHIRENDLNEAEYQGRKVKLGKPMRGDVKKFKVYVKNPAGNVVKVNFGQGKKNPGGTMRIRKSNPKARANFRARHNCDNPGPRHKARYWSCRKW